MTVMMSCDHHDVGGCVPDSRSRKRMLMQLGRGLAMSDALGELYHSNEVRYDLRDGRPVVIMPLKEMIPLFIAWLDWLQIQPHGDDWAPAVDPPAEIHVPKLED